MWQPLLELSTSSVCLLSKARENNLAIAFFKLQRVKLHELGEAVILDADTNVIQSPFTDLESLPLEVSSNLKRSLKSHKDLLGDSVARAFLQALVHLIGGYRDALKFRQVRTCIKACLIFCLTYVPYSYITSISF